MRLSRIDRLSWKLGISIALLVIGGLAAGFLLVHRHHYDELLSAARRGAASEASLIRQALEHQMLEKDRRLIRDQIKSFARDGAVRRVMVLDRNGLVRHSSDPAIQLRHFDRDSPTCQVCHRQPEANRGRSTMLEIAGGSILRCVEPIPNRPACHRCHDRRHRINGLIIADVRLDHQLRDLQHSVGGLALGTGAIGLVLLGGIGLILRRLVLRRLLRFEETARAIAAGDLERRVPIESDDALTRVESQFNRMADSVTELLAKLREQRASLEKVMNSVDDGLLVLDSSRTVVAVNDALVRRFGRPAGTVIGLRCCDPVVSGPLGCAGDAHGQCPTAACFATGRVQTAIRTRVAADGTPRVEEVQASPIHSPEDGVTHVVEVWRDITDRRSAEARLADYQRMVSLGMLASGFSHEVNTPLASIAMCLEGIKRCSADLQDQAQRQEAGDLVRVALEQVERCGGITRQFLALARGKSLAREIVDLPHAASAIARLCERTAGSAGVRIEVAAQKIPAVLANGSAVQQVLLNLVLNGIDASSQGQVVRIGFERNGGIALLVHDDGRGIAPEDLGRIFEPFFTRRPHGTGLGLFVSLDLARGWGGDIQVTSTPGAGTTFRVLFPATDTETESDGADAHPRG